MITQSAIPVSAAQHKRVSVHVPRHEDAPSSRATDPYNKICADIDETQYRKVPPVSEEERARRQWRHFMDRDEFVSSYAWQTFPSGRLSLVFKKLGSIPPSSRKKDHSSPARPLAGHPRFERALGQRLQVDVGQRQGAVEARLLNHLFHLAYPRVLHLAGTRLQNIHTNRW